MHYANLKPRQKKAARFTWPGESGSLFCIRKTARSHRNSPCRTQPHPCPCRFGQQAEIKRFQIRPVVGLCPWILERQKQFQRIRPEGLCDFHQTKQRQAPASRAVLANGRSADAPVCGKTVVRTKAHDPLESVQIEGLVRHGKAPW